MIGMKPIYLCPLCEQPMLAVGFCHLICPAGHYQEVCSDLFAPDRIDDSRQKDHLTAETNKDEETIYES